VLLAVGVPLRSVGYVWAFQQLVVVFSSPFLGLARDRSTHPWGRRRYFMAWMLVVGVLSALLFANAKALGLLMGDTSSEHAGGIIIAVISMAVRP
jgi:Na+/melibiose symporter-like transporter